MVRMKKKWRQQQFANSPITTTKPTARLVKAIAYLWARCKEFSGDPAPFLGRKECAHQWDELGFFLAHVWKHDRLVYHQLGAQFFEIAAHFQFHD